MFASAPAIISVSYGDAEQDAPEIFVRRTCLEALKLAALGKTVTFSTGDTGATLTSSVSPSSSCTSPLQAGFPASCPYVVAAGGWYLFCMCSWKCVEDDRLLFFLTSELLSNCGNAMQIRNSLSVSVTHTDFHTLSFSPMLLSSNLFLSDKIV